MEIFHVGKPGAGKEARGVGHGSRILRSGEFLGVIQWLTMIANDTTRLTEDRLAANLPSIASYGKMTTTMRTDFAPGDRHQQSPQFGFVV